MAELGFNMPSLEGVFKSDSPEQQLLKVEKEVQKVDDNYLAIINDNAAQMANEYANTAKAGTAALQKIAKTRETTEQLNTQKKDLLAIPAILRNIVGTINPKYDLGTTEKLIRMTEQEEAQHSRDFAMQSDLLGKRIEFLTKQNQNILTQYQIESGAANRATSLLKTVHDMRMQERQFQTGRTDRADDVAWRRAMAEQAQSNANRSHDLSVAQFNLSASSTKLAQDRAARDEAYRLHRDNIMDKRYADEYKNAEIRLGLAQEENQRAREAATRAGQLFDYQKNSLEADAKADEIAVQKGKLSLVPDTDLQTMISDPTKLGDFSPNLVNEEYGKRVEREALVFTRQQQMRMGKIAEADATLQHLTTKYSFKEFTEKLQPQEDGTFLLDGNPLTAGEKTRMESAIITADRTRNNLSANLAMQGRNAQLAVGSMSDKVLKAVTATGAFNSTLADEATIIGDTVGQLLKGGHYEQAYEMMYGDKGPGKLLNAKVDEMIKNNYTAKQVPLVTAFMNDAQPAPGAVAAYVGEAGTNLIAPNDTTLAPVISKFESIFKGKLRESLNMADGAEFKDFASAMALLTKRGKSTEFENITQDILSGPELQKAYFGAVEETAWRDVVPMMRDIFKTASPGQEMPTWMASADVTNPAYFDPPTTDPKTGKVTPGGFNKFKMLTSLRDAYNLKYKDVPPDERPEISWDQAVINALHSEDMQHRLHGKFNVQGQGVMSYAMQRLIPNGQNMIGIWRRGDTTVAGYASQLQQIEAQRKEAADAIATGARYINRLRPFSDSRLPSPGNLDDRTKKHLETMEQLRDDVDALRY